MRLIIATLVLWWLLALSTMAQCYPPPPAIIAWWPGNGNTLDISGTNGYLIWSNQSPAYVTGEVGQAFAFGGSGVISSTNPGASYLPGYAPNFTMESWINFQGTNHNVAFIANDQFSNGFKWLFGYSIFTSDNELCINSQNYPASAVSFGVPFTAVSNQWYHLAIVASNNIAFFYTNGLLAGVVVPTQQLTYNSQSPITIGGGNPNDGFFFNGYIDEMTMYMTNLSSTQIQGIYNAGIAGKCGSLPSGSGFNSAFWMLLGN